MGRIITSKDKFRPCPSCHEGIPLHSLSKRLIRCRHCFHLICNKCAIKKLCNDCYIKTTQQIEFTDYFKDKYGEVKIHANI